MALVKYSQIDTINAVISEWWTLPGLPLPLQKSLLSIRKALAESRETREELRKKLIEDYSARDESGNPIDVDVPVFGEDGTPLKDANGKPVTDKVRKFTDDAEVNAKWNEITATIFECPTIAESLIAPHIEKLSITLQKLEIIEALIVE